MAAITTIFFDLGGVCLSNGWDHEQRQALARQFGFDYESFDSRHRQVVDALERGQLTLDDYLQWTLFYQPRAFQPADIVDAIEQLSTPFAETLAIVKALRASGRYLLATLNNESRELNAYRIQRFGLRELFVAFFTSCYLGLLKPQPEHYRRALQITQRDPDECLFVDDRPMNVEVAHILGMHPIQFVDAARLASDLRAAGIDF
jgi:putative hydrolase of the HAD superfamily